MEVIHGFMAIKKKKKINHKLKDFYAWVMVNYGGEGRGIHPEL